MLSLLMAKKLLSKMQGLVSSFTRRNKILCTNIRSWWTLNKKIINILYSEHSGIFNLIEDITNIIWIIHSIYYKFPFPFVFSFIAYFLIDSFLSLVECIFCLIGICRLQIFLDIASALFLKPIFIVKNQNRTFFRMSLQNQSFVLV